MCQSLHLEPTTAGWQLVGNVDPNLPRIQLPDAACLFHPRGICCHLTGQLCLLKKTDGSVWTDSSLEKLHIASWDLMRDLKKKQNTSL